MSWFKTKQVEAPKEEPKGILSALTLRGILKKKEVVEIKQEDNSKKIPSAAEYRVIQIKGWVK